MPSAETLRGLTPAQRQLLRELADKPQRVVSGYRPALALHDKGLAIATYRQSAFGLVVTITDAGRALLAQSGEAS